MLMMFEKFDPDDEKSMERWSDFLGPSAVDRSVRMALQMCWMMLPQERKNVDELEKEFRRIVDRAVNDLREDDQAFGGSSAE